MKNKIPAWLIFSVLSMFMNGIWGALIEIPEKRLSPAFPTTLGFIIWTLTFIPCALYLLYRVNWKIEYSAKSILNGLLVGISGAFGQFMLFTALQLGPAYIIFPIVSVYPVITILLSVFILKERTHIIASVGIGVSLIAILLLSMQPAGGNGIQGYLWLWLSIIAFIMWGFQGFYFKVSLKSMHPESIGFYMMISNLFFIPWALYLTDFSQPINWRTGLTLSILIQFLNSIGALLGVFAVRHGKAIVVIPIACLAPVITTVLSLIIYARMPYYLNGIGIVTAMVAMFMITYGELFNEQLKKTVTD
ncbi:MAG: DMT family transporter [Chlorobi bacterium]|nr:DMT family transporter [Chlorobiota bacterium]